VNPDRVAREPARPHLEQRECVVCGESDQLRIHESQVAAGKVKDILTEEADHLRIFLNEEGVLEHGETRYAFVTIQILQKL
jgi:hypothetical protein